MDIRIDEPNNRHTYFDGVKSLHLCDYGNGKYRMRFTDNRGDHVDTTLNEGDTVIIELDHYNELC